jgi:hypothetical protein
MPFDSFYRDAWGSRRPRPLRHRRFMFLTKGQFAKNRHTTHLAHRSSNGVTDVVARGAYGACAASGTRARCASAGGYRLSQRLRGSELRHTSSGNPHGPAGSRINTRPSLSLCHFERSEPRDSERLIPGQGPSDRGQESIQSRRGLFSGQPRALSNSIDQFSLCHSNYLPRISLRSLAVPSLSQNWKRVSLCQVRCGLARQAKTGSSKALYQCAG